MYPIPVVLQVGNFGACDFSVGVIPEKPVPEGSNRGSGIHRVPI